MEDAIVAIAHSEYRPVPKQVHEEKHHRKGVIDPAAIVALMQEPLPAGGAMLIDLQQVLKWKYSFLYEDRTFPAIGAFTGKEAGEKGRHVAKLAN